MPPKPQLTILMCLVSFATVLGVLYTPALPQVAAYFTLSKSQAQSTMTLYLLGYGVGPLFYGPLADRFGRRPVIQGAALFAALTSLLAAFSATFGGFWLLAAMRFLMAVGASAGMTLSYTMIGDAYDKVEARKALSYLMLSFAGAPGIAATIGGVLAQRLSWQSCFYFTAFYSALLFLLTLRLPETLKAKKPEALIFKVWAATYADHLRRPRLLLIGVIMGIGTGLIYLFAAEAPFIGIHLVGLDPESYGALNLVPPIGMIAGSFLSASLAGRWDTFKVMALGMALCLLGALLMAGGFSLGWVTALALFGPFIVIRTGFALINANAAATALLHLKDKAHTSSVLNFTNMMVCTALVGLMQALPSEQPIVMPLLFVGLSGLLFALLAIVKNIQPV